MIGDVIFYARARMKALGLKESDQPFSSDTVPKTLLDKSYNLVLGVARGVSNNQNMQQTEVPIIITVYRSPARDVRPRVDDGAALGDSIIAEFISAKNRTTQAALKNVAFNTLSIESLSKTNDNGVLIKLTFTALVLSSTG